MSINLLSLRAIISLLIDLKECYGEEKLPGIDAYLAELEKIPVADTQAIARVVDEWENVVRDNLDAIISRDANKWLRIETGLKINFPAVFGFAAKDEAAIIWAHLETITATLIPEHKTLLNKPKEQPKAPPLDPALLINVFKGVMSGDGPSLDVSKFEQIPELAAIPKMVEKLEKNLDADSNPNQMIGTILSSPEFLLMIQGFQKHLDSGQLDINQILSMFVPAAAGK